MHLTNYSINKKADGYVKNNKNNKTDGEGSPDKPEEPQLDEMASKWSL